MRIRIGHQLIRALGGRIQTHGLVHPVLDREWHLGVGPVDRTRGGKHQVGHLLLAAPFENVEKAHQVGIRVGMGINQRIARADLRREVHHSVVGFLFEQALDLRAVG